MEQVIGLSALWLTLYTISFIVGLHLATIVVHFGLYAAMALLNHTGQDVRFYWFGFEYSVAAHEMHHRYPQVCICTMYLGILSHLIFGKVFRASYMFASY